MLGQKGKGSMTEPQESQHLQDWQLRSRDIKGRIKQNDQHHSEMGGTVIPSFIGSTGFFHGRQSLPHFRLSDKAFVHATNFIEPILYATVLGASDTLMNKKDKCPDFKELTF